MARVVFSPAARRDLHDIKAYIAERHVLAAERIISEFERIARLLEDSPEMGRRRDEVMLGLRSMAGAPPYVIFYRYQAESGNVEIVRILHGQRDLKTVITGMPDTH